MCDEQSGFYKQRIPLSGASQAYPRTVSGSLSVGDIHGLFASPRLAAKCPTLSACMVRPTRRKADGGRSPGTRPG